MCKELKEQTTVREKDWHDGSHQKVGRERGESQNQMHEEKTSKNVEEQKAAAANPSYTQA